MVEELWTSKQVIEHLGITINNLRQLQFRKTIAWAKKEGKSVLYRAEEIRAYKEKRKHKTVK